MENVTLTEWLERENNINNQVVENEERVDEFLLTLTAMCVFAYCCQPLLNTEFAKTVGGGLGMMLGGIGSGINNITSMFKRKEGSGSDDNKKSKPSKEEQEGAAAYTKMNMAMKAADRAIEGEKDKNLKAKLKQKMATLKASTTTEDGRLLFPTEWAKRYKEVSGTDPKDDLKDTASSVPKEDLDKAEKGVTDGVKKDTANMTSEQLEKQTRDAQTESQTTAKNLPAIRTASTPEQVEAVTKSVNDEVKVQQEYREKIEKAETQEEKDKLQKELDEKTAEIKKKTEEAAKTEPKKDEESKKDEEGEDGQPAGTTSKEEEIEIEDPKTGEKKKVKKKVYTGPQGGRYYFPDGKPKTPENKVYVKESLTEHLINIFSE